MRFAGAPRRMHVLPIALALAGAALVLALAFTRLDIRTDMTDLLPRGKTDAARMMLDELRSGPATSLILVGIEGAPPETLARISRAMRGSMQRSGLFALIENGGGEELGGSDEQFLFRNRYLLSPAVTADAFTVPALRDDFRHLLDALQSSAGPLAAQFGFADPTGAFLGLLRDWAGASPVRTINGVWFAADRDRALMLLRTRAPGMDLTGQEKAAEAIRAAFAAAEPGSARLLATGPAVFARDAARKIHGDVQLLSVFSTLLIVALLLWRFRSPWVIAAIAVPVLLSIAFAALTVQLAFGFVHGVTLGFGMTMLGVTVDYPVLLIGHRKQGEAAAGTLRRIGRAFALAVTTAALGLTGMLFSGFPGLAQLGLFSVTGILVAAATTRWFLPKLIVLADLAPVPAGDPARLLRVEALRSWRWLGLAVCLGAALYLILAGGPRWQRELVALSPVPSSALALDAELRAELGAPDPGVAGLVRGPTAEAVLRQEEALSPMLDDLRRGGAIEGAEVAARFLPSQATQLARRAALPRRDVLAARVAEAGKDLPFRADAFRPFLNDVETSRGINPILPADVPGPVLGARLEALLLHRGADWYGLIVPTALRDPARVEQAFRSAGVTWVDMRAEANGIVAEYTASAWHWLAYGGIAALAALLVGLRDPVMVARVVGAILGAALVTVALLTAAGVQLSMVNIVALQFVGGVGLDYALFFARRQLDAEERARTLRTLSICNAMTVLTFGLLAFCRTPLLRQIGLTVVIGALGAICLAFLFAGEKSRIAPETA